jgi:hypothetical protein
MAVEMLGARLADMEWIGKSGSSAAALHTNTCGH